MSDHIDSSRRDADGGRKDVRFRTKKPDRT
nr:MAG TPA: hypothetical protein [Caudoviricetes sp.]